MRVVKTACAPSPRATSTMSPSRLSRLSCWTQWRAWPIEPERMRNSTETRTRRDAKGRVIARLFEFVAGARPGLTAAFHIQRIIKDFGHDALAKTQAESWLLPQVSTGDRLESLLGIDSRRGICPHCHPSRCDIS